jgi:HAMP domain-containing protein
MKSLYQMENRLRELEAAIRETEARLPAHSVKPPVMMELLALEDERETLLQQIRSRKADASDG